MRYLRLTLIGHGIAVVAVLTAFLALRVEPGFARAPYLPFFIAVLASAWLAGLRPGLLAIGLSLLLVNTLVPQPEPNPYPSSPLHRALVFLVTSLLATFLGTFRWRWQQRLEHQTKVLREADRRKDEFLAILAHELRNGLAPLRNALEVIRLRGNDRRESVQWAYGVLDRQVRQLGRLVDDLLDISRVARGKLLLTRAPLDLANVLQRAVEISRPLIDTHTQQLTIALPSEPLWIEGDGDRLTQVFVNLLTNASKYTPDNGQVQLSAEREDNTWVVRVRDNGIGITADVLPRIFDLFAQGERVPGREQAGLGIGLTLVRSLVELHGGRVEVQSEGRGCGSTFVVRLPIGQAPPAAPPVEPPRPVTAVPRRRVLVVDDNVDAAESLSVFLRLAGHEVTTVHDGNTGLQLARAGHPDVILLDIGLPDIDGYEVARRLRAEPGTRDALLVALTGYGQDEDRRRSAEAGFDLHLVKPVEPAELAQVLAMPPQVRDKKRT